MNVIYEVLKGVLPFALYIIAIKLNSHKVGIFKNKFVFMIVCFLAALFMPRYLSSILIIAAILLVIIKTGIEENKISDIRNYIKDNSIQGYHLMFRLINNDVITDKTSIEEFNKIREWYDSEREQIYRIHDEEKSRYINLNKAHIVEFSYNTVTNKKNIINPIIYFATMPAPEMFNITSYIKGLAIAPILLGIYILYEKYIVSANMNLVLANTPMLNRTLSNIIYLVAIIFITGYIIFFSLKLSGMTREAIDYYYKVKEQQMNKLYNYASINFIMVSFISFMLLSVKLL